MPKTQINCPNCRQPIVADVLQLFDTSVNPQAKQMILSGTYNLARCPQCGYQGNLATPIVYHDPEKELLLTYFPPELSLPVNEQERIIGPLVNQAMNNLPVEKRKGYLFRPQTMLTLQGMVERILQADGITKEMLQEQQKRITLLGRLLDASDSAAEGIIREEDAALDAEFFTLLGRLLQASAGSGDQNAVEKLGKLQEKLLTFSTFGKQVKNQSDEFQSAVKTIEEIGKDLTREKLLDLFIQAPSETRLSVLVSLTRPGLDYEFYQILSEKIDRARAEERDKLLALREKLLSITESIDQAVEARVNRARETLNQVLATSNPAEALQNSDATIDDFFLQALSEELEKARKAGDLERIDKIRQIDSMLQQAMKPSREVELVQRFLGFEAESEQEKFLEENRQGITPEFMETLSAMMAQLQAGGENPELVAHVENAYRTALRFSMKMNL
jgi:hypothetical protein